MLLVHNEGQIRSDGRLLDQTLGYQFGDVEWLISPKFTFFLWLEIDTHFVEVSLLEVDDCLNMIQDHILNLRCEILL